MTVHLLSNLWISCFTCLSKSLHSISPFFLPERSLLCSLKKINLVDFSSSYLDRYYSMVRVLPKLSFRVKPNFTTPGSGGKTPSVSTSSVMSSTARIPKAEVGISPSITLLQFLIPPALIKEQNQVKSYVLEGSTE